MVAVDQVDEVAKGLPRFGIVEREGVAALEHPAGRSDVVEVDALRVVGGVVAPLPNPLEVEVRCVGPMSSGVDGDAGQQRSQGVVAGRTPAQGVQLGGIDPGGGQQVGVVEQRDPRIGRLRDPHSDPLRVNWSTTAGSQSALPFSIFISRPLSA